MFRTGVSQALSRGTAAEVKAVHRGVDELGETLDPLEYRVVPLFQKKRRVVLWLSCYGTPRGAPLETNKVICQDRLGTSTGLRKVGSQKRPGEALFSLSLSLSLSLFTCSTPRRTGAGGSLRWHA